MKKLLLFMFLFVAFNSSGVCKDNDSNLSWIGLVRDDGVLIPFAQFDGKTWSKSWPDTVEVRNPGYVTTPDKIPDEFFGLYKSWLDAIEVPTPDYVTIPDKIPDEWLGIYSSFPREWKLFKKGGLSDKIRCAGLCKYSAHCSDEWGVKTNIKSSKDYINQGYIPKIGIAYVGDLQFMVPETITKTSSEYPVLWKLIMREYAVKGESVYKNKQYWWAALVSKEFQNKNTLNLEEIKKIGDQAYYFSMKIIFPTQPGSTNQGGGWLEGWIIKDSKGNFKVAQSSMSVSDSPSNDYSYDVFGYLVQKNKVLIIMGKLGYEHEEYNISEITGEGLKTIIEIDGGGC